MFKTQILKNRFGAHGGRFGLAPQNSVAGPCCLVRGMGEQRSTARTFHGHTSHTLAHRLVL